MNSFAKRKLDHVGPRYSIKDLPNECLISILCLLDLSDLTSVGATSHRFRSLSCYVFALKHKGFMCTMIEDTTVSRFLFVFGDVIHSIELGFVKWVKMHHVQFKRKLDWILRNFPNLLKLRTRYNEIGECAAWEKIGQKLAILDLDHPIFDISKINKWENLVVFTIGNPKYKLDEVLNALESQSIKYIHLHGFISDESIFKKFALRNTQIKELQLTICYNKDPLFLSGIKFLHNLERFVFDITLGVCWQTFIINDQLRDTYNNLYNELASIESLRYLYFPFEALYFDSILNIKQLKLLLIGQFTNEFHCNTEQFRNGIVNNMQSLEELDIHRIGPMPYTFIERLPKLKRICISGNEMNHNYYMKLVKICTNQSRAIQIVLGSPFLIDAFYQKYPNTVQLIGHMDYDSQFGFHFPESEILNSKKLAFNK